jgi:hypothetical protein
VIEPKMIVIVERKVALSTCSMISPSPPFHFGFHI